MKASIALSVLLHAVLVGALFLIGSTATGKKEVFFVELKSISVNPASGRTEKATPAGKPKATSPKKVAKPEKKQPVEEVKESPVVEKVVEEAPAEEPEDLVNYVVETPEQSDGESEAKDVASSDAYVEEDFGGLLSGGEEFAPSSGPNASGNYSNEVLRRIRDAIQAELSYPPLARKRRLEGTVVAGFTIDAWGAPHEIEIVESSGYSVLDREVVKIIQRAAPYPYIPERVEVPVSFRLVTDR